MLVLKTSDFSSSTLAPQSENQKSKSSKSFRKMNKINNNNNNKRQLCEGEQLPAREKCPRCESTNTKFCYYNNYSKSQPRHFCRSCKRHWTLGGTLRAVPVGGASKNKRLKTANPSNASVAAPSNTSNGGEFPLIPALPDLPRSQIFPLSTAAAGSSPSSFDSLGQSSSVVDYVSETLVEVPGVSVAGQPWESSWSWGDLDVLLSGGGLGVPYDDDYYEIFRP